MGHRVDGKMVVDLNDLKQASGEVDRLYGPRHSFAYTAPDYARFVICEPAPVVSYPPKDEVIMPAAATFELLRRTVHEPVGRSTIRIWDYWYHGDVLVRRVEVGSYYKRG